MGKRREAEPGRTPGWRVAFLVLCAVGVLLSADLQRLHVNVHTDPDYASYCAMSERVNCETVAASDHAVFAGLPVAVWGILAYGAMGLLAVWGLRFRLPTPTWPFGALYWLSLFASAVGVGLFLVSHYVIESVCLICAGTYLVNLALLGAAAMTLRRQDRGPVRALAEEWRAGRRVRGPVATLLALVGMAVILLQAEIPRYWLVESATGPGGVPVGKTSEGLHWIGARDPGVVIVEYSDYECPHCRRAHTRMRELVLRQPGVLRLVHRHYPLDQECNPALQRPFHLRACSYARMAHCAGEQGRFWEANDFLYAHGRDRQPVSSRALADALGIDLGELAACTGEPGTKRVIAEDLSTGRALSIRGTPTFVLNGSTYPGGIPEDVLERALRGAGAD